MTLQLITTPLAVQAQVRQWRAQGQRVALVPTMGNLHLGHATLVAEARKHADRVMVSIFVNPLQFGPHEDFTAYPRTPDEDRRLLEQYQADALFAPEVADMYPGGMLAHTRVEVPEVSDILCGAFRPGHFVGVATVVAKLFSTVLPDVAVFGEKDFQQLHIIRRMATDLCLPLNIVGVPTVREPNGLAMSSRNRYLTPEQRAQAALIYAVLSEVAAGIKASRRDYDALEQGASDALVKGGFKPDYVSVRDAETLALPSDTSRRMVVLTAARLGRARLIDNVRVDL